MSSRLPRGHLSPSQLTAFEMCEIRYRIFNVENAKSPPDFALHAKIKTHEVLLEKDLAQKITSGANVGDSELVEMYRAEMEQSLPLAKEDPNLEGEPAKVVESESVYFEKLAKVSRPWRVATKPVAVEKPLEGSIGGIPVVARLDLISDEVICDRIQDLKRMGSPPGDATQNRQLVTYSLLTGIQDVGLTALVEKVHPYVKTEQGQVTVAEQSRVVSQYQGTAFKIENAVEKDIWTPVDHGDPRKSWICSKRYCGAWASDSRDWLTGRNIACPYGQRSVVSVTGGKSNGG